MGIALTNGNKICVMGEGTSSKLKNVLGEERYNNLKKLEASGEEIYFEDNKQENSEVQSPNE